MIHYRRYPIPIPPTMQTHNNTKLPLLAPHSMTRAIARMVVGVSKV